MNAQKRQVNVRRKRFKMGEGSAVMKVLVKFLFILIIVRGRY